MEESLEETLEEVFYDCEEHSVQGMRSTGSLFVQTIRSISRRIAFCRGDFSGRVIGRTANSIAFRSLNAATGQARTACALRLQNKSHEMMQVYLRSLRQDG